MSDKKERDFENPAETTSSRNTPFKQPSVPSTSATTSTWSRFKDPRVVRVSRALGGKDRHSKVCTVRGLRDRRVRLSVPTAIQLYDLQERLGLNQPSKVVDWLLNAAKREIDELPPLQIPQGMFNFSNNHHHGNNYNLDQPMLNFQDFVSGSQLPDKQGLKIGSTQGDHGDEDWARNQEERQFHHHLEDTNNNNSISSSSSYNSIFKLDPSNLTLSHAPRAAHVSAQHEDWHSFGLLPFQPTLSTGPPGPHQVLVYHQQGAGIMSTQAYLPTNGELGPKHEVNFQRSQLSTSSFSSTMDSNSQPAARQIHFNMTANLLPSQDHNGETET